MEAHQAIMLVAHEAVGTLAEVSEGRRFTPFLIGGPKTPLGRYSGGTAKAISQRRVLQRSNA